jgi:hypothetical protein
MLKFLRRIFANAPPESNAAALGGGEETRRSFRIENRDREPRPDVTQVKGLGTIGGIFKSDVERQESEFKNRHVQRRQQSGLGEMTSYLKDGGIFRDK